MKKEPFAINELAPAPEPFPRMKLIRSDLADMETTIDRLNAQRDVAILHEGRFETSCSLHFLVTFNQETSEYELEIINE